MVKRIQITLLFYLVVIQAYSSLNKDSLYSVWNDKSKALETRFDAFFDLVWDEMYRNPDTALFIAKQFIKEARQYDSSRYIAIGQNAAGVAFWVREDYDSAVFFLRKCMTLSDEIDYGFGKASSRLNLGMVYDVQSDYKNAQNYYLEALSHYEDLKDQNGISVCYNNLSMLYKTQGLYDKAIEYILKALKIDESLGDLKSISISYNNIGLLYNDMADNETALSYYLKCLDINKELKDSIGQAFVMNNIGLVYHDALDYHKAIKTYKEALLINNGKDNEISSKLYYNIGVVYLDMEQFDTAKKYLKRALLIKKEINHKEGLFNTYLSLGKLYLSQGHLDSAKQYLETVRLNSEEMESIKLEKELNYLFYKLSAQTKSYSEALKYLEEFMKLNDSILKESNHKKLLKQNYKYEYEKQKALDDKENEKKMAIQKEKQHQQYIVIVAISVGAGLIMVFLIIIYRRLQITRKQKIIIEEQKEEVESQRDHIEKQKGIIEEKHTEIQDSISYARRIQEAILPSVSGMLETLKEAFVLYLPKDVVAGDFYWFERLNNKVYLAAADCTGHGVPGAMVSVVCSNALTKSLLEEGITDTGEILDRTREIVIDRLAKSGEDQPDSVVGVKDGMDISLACIDYTSMELYWSGANNPLYFIKNNAKEVEIIKADKQPIGFVKEPKPFLPNHIKLQAGDSFYFFTDGYPDQFGGPKGKKFGYKRFRELLFEISTYPMEQQKEILQGTLEHWMFEGKEQQVDDICIIGVRI